MAIYSCIAMQLSNCVMATNHPHVAMCSYKGPYICGMCRHCKHDSCLLTWLTQHACMGMGKTNGNSVYSNRGESVHACIMYIELDCWCMLLCYRRLKYTYTDIGGLIYSRKQFSSANKRRDLILS